MKDYKTTDFDSEKLDKKVHLSMLYDFYGELLKDNHKEIFENYVLDDLSLSEIADFKGISRQGVHDIIKRSTKQLEEYEERLKLMDIHMQIRQKVLVADEILKNIEANNDVKKDVSAIKKIFDEILDII